MVVLVVKVVGFHVHVHGDGQGGCGCGVLWW